jgi:hypothetical protein
VVLVNEEMSTIYLCPSVVSASSVTNHSIEIVGRISLDFTLCHTTLASACSQYNWNFYVAKGISYECLLGLDFLKAYEGKVDISNRMCELKNYGSNVVYKLFDLPDYCHVLSVHVCSDMFIQPRVIRVMNGTVIRISLSRALTLVALQALNMMMPIAAAAKLNFKNDEELIKEFDVGDAETAATDKTLILDVLKSHMNVFLPDQNVILAELKCTFYHRYRVFAH